jgi:hypothetical protein
MANAPDLALGTSHLFPASGGSALVGRLRKLTGSGLAWGILVSIGVAAWILVSLGGQAYYGTSLDVRAYEPAHRLLKPSGPIGQSLGLVGTILMIVPFVYSARKRVKGLAAAGTLKSWLEIHLFCGIVGPVLVTFHTAFKFNGIISAAYWSMVIVVLSGFVGRYLYVRIPRSIRGNELTRADLDRRAADLQQQIHESVDSEDVLARIEAFEARIGPAVGSRLSVVDAVFGEVGLTRRVRRFEAELGRSGVPEGLGHDIARHAAERSIVLRRAAYLQRTKALFELWHVFHLPLVYILLAIATVHIALALYMGYVPFRWS